MSGVSSQGATYTHDADGNRVSRSGDKVYWYGLRGEVLAESDTSGNITAEYIYFNGRRSLCRLQDQAEWIYLLAGYILPSSREYVRDLGTGRGLIS